MELGLGGSAVHSSRGQHLSCGGQTPPCRIAVTRYRALSSLTSPVCPGRALTKLSGASLQQHHHLHPAPDGWSTAAVLHQVPLPYFSSSRDSTEARITHKEAFTLRSSRTNQRRLGLSPGFLPASSGLIWT